MAAWPQLVQLITHVPPSTLLTPLGEKPPTLSNGFGGWKTIDRPRRVAFTEWDGSQPFRMDLPLMLEGGGQDVGGAVSQLNQMAQVPLGATEPPTVRLVGIIFGALEAWDWVIEDIAYDETVRDENGTTVRQPCSVKLLQYVKADRIQRVAGKKKTTPAKYRTYTIKRGDTLQKIAKKLLKNTKRWKELATLNKIRDPKKLRVGSKIKVPLK